MKAIKKPIKRRHSGVSARAPLVVFSGLDTGIYDSWNVARRLVEHVPKAIYVRYPNPTAAKAAYNYALHMGWVRKLDGGIWSTVKSVGRAAFSLDDVRNPLTGGIQAPYYCVFRGLRPGIYRS